MLVIVARHGKAERDSPSGLDADRDLTERGRAQAQWLGQHVLSLGERPSLLLTSPIARARQTAEQIATAIDLLPTPESRLSTDAMPSDVLEVIAEHEGRRCIALVGHNPHFEQSISIMLHGVGHGVRLRTGEAAVLDVADPVDVFGKASLIEFARMPKGAPRGSGVEDD